MHLIKINSKYKSPISTILLVILMNANLAFSGTNWVQVDAYRYKPNGFISPTWIRYVSISCSDTNNCIAVGNINSYYPWNRVTSDGGKTWFTTLMDSVRRDSNDYLLYNPSKITYVFYPDTNLCIILGDSNYYWRSIDKCHTWNKYKLNAVYIDNQMQSYFIDMFDLKEGALITPFELFQTVDGGLTWKKTVINLPDSSLPVVYISLSIPETNVIRALVYKSGLGVYLLRTEDNGITWDIRTTIPRNISGIFFKNANEGWGVGREYVDKKGYKDIILHTTNGGNDWEIQLDTVAYLPFGLIGLKMMNNGFGLAYGDGFKMWRTSNFGKAWIKDSTYSKTGFDDYFIDIALLNNETAIAITNDLGYIYKKEFKITDVQEHLQYKECSEPGISISPNPATDYIEISVPVGARHALPEAIRIYNVFGEEINLTTTLSMLGEGENNPLNPPLKRGNLKIDVSHLTPGVYFVRVGEKVGKFVKI